MAVFIGAKVQYIWMASILNTELRNDISIAISYYLGPTYSTPSTHDKSNKKTHRYIYMYILQETITRPKQTNPVGYTVEKRTTPQNDRSQRLVQDQEIESAICAVFNLHVDHQRLVARTGTDVLYMDMDRSDC
jgi:hypothetical protein